MHDMENENWNDASDEWHFQKGTKSATEQNKKTQKRGSTPVKFWMKEFFEIELLILENEIKRVEEVTRKKIEKYNKIQQKIKI